MGDFYARFADGGPRLETPRLVLRLPSNQDFAAWCELMADEESARHIGGVQPPSVVWRSLAGMAGSWVLQGFGMFSVLERQTGRWIGRVGPWKPHGWPITEVGWSLLRSHWGQGYATEAAAASMDWAFKNLGWTEIGHVIDPDNQASIRVAERLGSKLRGPVRLPAPLEALEARLYAQRREDFRL